jgi:hypothetical protein
VLRLRGVKIVLGFVGCCWAFVNFVRGCAKGGIAEGAVGGFVSEGRFSSFFFFCNRFSFRALFVGLCKVVHSSSVSFESVAVGEGWLE